ncbi:MAG: ribosome maturation factor RimP [Candidatus Omnitrophota bacterium]|jgi:ribosome maturation factor RimP
MMEDIEARINACLTPILQENGADLVELSVKRAQRRIIIRVFADRPEGGITIGQCSLMNKQLARQIAEEAVINGDYSVEVCSPGIDWPLVSGKDFMRVRGRPVRIVLAEPLGGRQEIAGKVMGVEGECVNIEINGELTGIPLRQIKKANQMLAEGTGHGQ